MIATLASMDGDSQLQNLINSARDGSNSGLGQLLESFRPALMDMAERKLADQIRRRVSISDLVQDTMLTACGQFSNFRGTTTFEFRDWLYQVFRSRLIDGLRRHQLAERRTQAMENDQVDVLSLADSQISPSELVILQDDSQKLLDALQDLPAESQQLIRMRYLENLTFENIAEKTGLSLSTVWRKFHEATLLLHKHLANGQDPAAQ